MKTTPIIGATTALAILSLAALSSARADAVNDARILRKAAGECKGSLILTISETPYAAGLPLTTLTTTSPRTGDVIIPGREGRSRSLVDHLSKPGATLDSTATGVVRDARVLRGGKLIVYAGSGNAEPVLDDDGKFAVRGSATSTIRGPKVVSTSKANGNRTLKDSLTLQTLEVTTVKGKARGSSLF